MFQYTKEVVLNSNVGTLDDNKKIINGDYYDNKGVLHTGESVVIEKIGEYKKRGILNNRIDKTSYVNAISATAVINSTVPLLLKNSSTGGRFVLEIHIKSDTRFFGEYANANWYAFGKPLIIEFNVTEAMLDDDAALTKAVYDAIKMAVPDNNKFMLVECAGTVITLTLPDAHFYFNRIDCSWFDPTQCDSCIGDFFDYGVVVQYPGETKTTPAIVITKNQVPFATGEWIFENLRFPSYPNMRWATSNDEMPILSGKYIQYSFLYDSLRPSLGGISAVGQKVESITRHTFYVLESVSADFERAFTAIGAMINLIDHSNHANAKHLSVEVEPSEPSVPDEPVA